MVIAAPRILDLPSIFYDSDTVFGQIRLILSRFSIYLVLELYLSSIPAYFCDISGVSVIFVVLNNAGSQKKTGKPDPGSATAS